MEPSFGGRRDLLVLGDEAAVLQGLRAHFKARCTVHACDRAEDGFRILQQTPVQVILCDERMPRTSGTEFFARVKSEYPDPVRILLTEYADVDAVNECGIFSCLTRPWKAMELDMAVEAAFERYDLVASNRRLQRDLENAREAAEAAGRTKSAFLACMSHEMRTPLTAILGFAQLLNSHGSLGAEQRKQVDSIRRSGEQMLGLVDDVIELSKVASGRGALKIVRFDLHRLLEDMEVMFSLTAARKGLALRVGRTSHLPRWVRADQGKLRHVLINLVGNAVKFTDRGGVTVHAAARDGTDLVIEVEDSGRGIASVDMAGLFRPFEQAGRTTGSGAGLGLALCKELCRIMGGTVAVDTRLYRGSMFRVCVPMAIDEAAPPTSSDAPLSQAAQPSDERPRTIVVDKHARRRMRALPDKVRAALCDCVLRADVEVVQVHLDDVAVHDPDMRDLLQALIDAFEYGQVLALLE